MIKFISDVVGILSDKQADVIIATIGFMSAVIVATIGLFGSAITLLLNKKNERKIELRKIKENQNIEFLGSIAEAKMTKANERHEINRLLSSRIQTIYLVGDDKVQKSLHDFLEIFTTGKVTAEEQNILYANLIKAMKIDLYGKKSSLSSVSFTVFDD